MADADVRRLRSLVGAIDIDSNDPSLTKIALLGHQLSELVGALLPEPCGYTHSIPERSAVTPRVLKGTSR